MNDMNALINAVNKHSVLC